MTRHRRIRSIVAGLAIGLTFAGATPLLAASAPRFPSHTKPPTTAQIIRALRNQVAADARVITVDQRTIATLRAEVAAAAPLGAITTPAAAWPVLVGFAGLFPSSGYPPCGISYSVAPSTYFWSSGGYSNTTTEYDFKRIVITSPECPA